MVVFELAFSVTPFWLPYPLNFIFFTPKVVVGDGRRQSDTKGSSNSSIITITSLILGQKLLGKKKKTKKNHGLITKEKTNFFLLYESMWCGYLRKN
jgi:hypothetical protein